MCLNRLCESPTLSRCDAASFFCDFSNTQNLMRHSLCRMIKEALKHRLGFRGKKKLPLLHEHISAIFTRQATQSHTLHTLVTCFRMATMYEGCLRWHDLAQVTFGDIIITKTFLRIFVEQAKTDAYRKGLGNDTRHIRPLLDIHPARTSIGYISCLMDKSDREYAQINSQQPSRPTST